MDLVAPSGPVYQAGTLSGNPLAVAAGAKTLELLRRPGTYDRLEMLGKKLASGLEEQASQARIPITVNRMGSMMTAFFNPGPVTDYSSAKKSDSGMFAGFFQELLERGVYFPPSQFESLFVSTAHTEDDIDLTIRAAGEALRAIRVAR
jgi:glutamate-1-semialdehyde 2,1-aminomutase